MYLYWVYTSPQFEALFEFAYGEALRRITDDEAMFLKYADFHLHETDFTYTGRFEAEVEMLTTGVKGTTTGTISFFLPHGLEGEDVSQILHGVEPVVVIESIPGKLTVANLPVARDFRLMLRAALLPVIPNQYVEFTLEGEVTVIEQKENELTGKFCLGSYIDYSDAYDDGQADDAAAPVTGTFSLAFRDPNDIPLNTPLKVDIHSYPA